MSQKVKYEIRRLKSFIKVFTRSKAGLAGVIIIAVFLIVAFGAPYMSPYDPIKTEHLAARLAAPVWLKYLPPQLGGKPDIIESFTPTKNIGFGSGTAEWNTTLTEHTDIKPTNIENKQTVSVSFQRQEANVNYGEEKMVLYQDFNYPHKGVPGEFIGTIAILVDGTYTTKTERIITGPNATFSKEVDENPDWWKSLSLEERMELIKKYAWIYTDVTRQLLDVPVKVNVFLQRLNDGQKWIFWPVGNPEYSIKGNQRYLPQGMQADGTIITFNSTRWLSTTDMPISSQDPSFTSLYGLFPQGDPLHIVFDKIPGDYRYGVEITFKDINSTKSQVSTTLHIDTLSFKLIGNAWGLLGTDHLGRDIWTQLLHGTKVSLYVGLLSAVLSVAIGLIVGLAAGYMGKTVDEVLMRFNDMLLVIPFLPLLIVLTAVLGATVENLIILLGILGWMGFARVVRSQVLSLKERPFVEAAKAIGAGRTHIMMRHILPNVMSLVYVTLATSVPGSIVAEAALSWLGFYDYYRMSWGRMLYDVQNSARAVQNWWWVIPPGLCIAALALAFIMLGFALDETLNPRLRMRR